MYTSPFSPLVMTISGLPNYGNVGLTQYVHNTVVMPGSGAGSSPYVSDGNLSYEFMPLLGLFGKQAQGNYYISGTVKDKNLLYAPRTVLALARSNFYLLDSTTSDPVTGAFTLIVSNQPCIVIVLPLEGEGVNAEIYDYITPIPISS